MLGRWIKRLTRMWRRPYIETRMSHCGPEQIATIECRDRPVHRCISRTDTSRQHSGHTESIEMESLSSARRGLFSARRCEEGMTGTWERLALNSKERHARTHWQIETPSHVNQLLSRSNIDQVHD